MEIIVTFLAMLELVKVRAIRIFQEEMAGPITIEPAAVMDSPASKPCSRRSRKSRMEREDVKSIVESLLFVADGPLTLQRFAEVLEGVDKETIQRRSERAADRTRSAKPRRAIGRSGRRLSTAHGQGQC